MSERHTLGRNKNTERQNRQAIKYVKTLYLLAFFPTALSVVFNHWVQTQTFPIGIGSAVILQYCGLALCMLLAWYCSPRNLSEVDFRWFLLAAVMIRIIVFAVEPYTSNDVSRYLFDGKILLEGLDPYSVPHNAPILADLKTVWQPPIEHEKYVTLYPPLAVVMFGFSALAGPVYGVWLWKLLVLLASVATLFVGSLLLKKLDQLKALPLIALSPILVLDIGEAAHLDIFTALSVIASLWFWVNGQIKRVGMALAMGTLVKLLPIVLLLPFFVFTKGLAKKVQLVGMTLFIVVAGYAVAFSLSLVPLGSIETFFVKWRSASVLFNFFDIFLSGSALSLTLAGIAVAAFAVIFACALRTSSALLSPNMLGLFQATLAVPLLVSPVVFPWYLAPLCVLIALRPSLFIVSWVILLPFVYEVLNQFLCCGVWVNASWPIGLMSGAFVSIFVLYLVRVLLKKPNMMVLKVNFFERDENFGVKIWVI